MAIVRNLEIRPTTVADLFTNGSELFQQHWSEIALNKHLMVLNPDRPRYEALEAAGTLIILGAYENNVLVGYSVSFVATHFHYSDLTVANNDLLFLKMHLRGTRLGLDLIYETEREAEIGRAHV